MTKAALHFCPVIFTLFFFGQSLSAYYMYVKWYCCTMSTHITSGMNLLSTFCIAVSATRKLNCVAVGVICVAVFFGVLEKKILELRDTFPAQPVQGIFFFKDSPSTAAMK